MFTFSRASFITARNRVRVGDFIFEIPRHLGAAILEKFRSPRRRTVAIILDMKAEKCALAFLNLFAVQRTLHHVGNVLYLDISLIPAACLRAAFVLVAARKNGSAR